MAVRGRFDPSPPLWTVGKQGARETMIFLEFTFGQDHRCVLIRLDAITKIEELCNETVHGRIENARIYTGGSEYVEVNENYGYVVGKIRQISENI